MASVLADLLVNLIGNDTQLLAATKRSTKAMEDLAATSVKTNATMKASAASAGGGLSKMADNTAVALGKITAAGKYAGLALLAIGAYSVDTAAKFQAAMELIHTQAGASQKEVDDLSKSVLALAPAVGIGPDKLADGLYHVESAGFRGKEALDILTAAAKNAATGMSDMDTTSQALIGTMTVQFKDVQNAADAASYLNRIVGIGDMRMQQLASAIATGVLPTFKDAGLGMKDFGAALATLTDNVTPANQAATRLRMTIALLAAPSQVAYNALTAVGLGADEASKALANRSYLEKYGISISKLSDDLQKPDGLLVAVDDLKSHLAKLSTGEQAAVLEKAFGGGRTSAAIQTLLSQSDRLKSKYDQLGTAAQRAADQQQSWAQTQATFRQQANQLGAGIQVMAIQLGEKLLPPLTKFVEYLNSHKAAMTAFFGTLLVFLGLLTTAFITFSIIVMADPVGAIVMGILVTLIALSYGIYELVKHWSTVWGAIKGVALDVWHALVTAWHATINALKVALDAVGGALVTAWNATWNALKVALEAVGGALVTAWNATWNAIKGTVGSIYSDVVKPVGDFFVAMGAFFESVWHGLVGVVEWIASNIFIPIGKFAWDYLLLPIRVVIDILVFLFKFAWGFMSVVITDFWHNYAEPAIHGIVSLIKLLWQGAKVEFDQIIMGIQVVARWFVTAWNILWADFVTPLINGFKLLVQEAQAAWNLLWADFVAPLINGFHLLVHEAQAAWTMLWAEFITPVINGFKMLADWAKFVWNQIYAAFIAPFIADVKLVPQAAQAAWNAIVAATNWLWQQLRNIWNAIYGGVIGPAINAVKDFGNWWKNVFNDAASAVSGFWGRIKGIFDKVTGALNDIKKGFNSIDPGKLGGNVAKLFGFADGGIVPGPVGAPMLAIVHGGEVVLPNTVTTGIRTGSAVNVASGSAGSVVADLGGGQTTTTAGGTDVIQVNIDGKKLFDFIVQRAQRNKGRNASTFLT